MKNLLKSRCLEINLRGSGAVNTKDSGYVRVYSKDTDGWFSGQPIIIAHANNQGLTITDGKRIVVDKLSVNGFTPGSVAIYGKDDSESPINAYAGNISFDMVFGILLILQSSICHLEC